MGESDAELIGRWQRGDGAAFTALVRRWEPPLARFLLRLVPADVVPDLSQEVFLRVYRSAMRYSENGHFSTWFFQIALNVARDSMRRTRTDFALPVVESIAAPEQDHDLGDAIARAVASLPPELREVIALRHDAGMAFEEMSRRLGVPASTLKSRFSVALRQLRARLRDWSPGPGGAS